MLPPSGRSSGLTDREAEILEYLVAGKRPKEISEMLVVSITTVRSHVRAIYAKTGVHSHGELMHLLDEKVGVEGICGGALLVPYRVS